MEGLSADMAFLCETWETEGKAVCLDDYQWFNHPRLFTNKNVTRGSGGVGFLVRPTLLSKYRVEVVSKEVEGVLILLLTDKISDMSILLIGCYFSPENSIYGRHIDEVLESITSILFEYTDVDITLMMGDMNARVGNMKDYIPEIDTLPDRIVIDTTDNSHGHALTDFLIETKLAIVNGRCCPLSDSFTYISHKAQALSIIL